MRKGFGIFEYTSGQKVWAIFAGSLAAAIVATTWLGVSVVDGIYSRVAASGLDSTKAEVLKQILKEFLVRTAKSDYIQSSITLIVLGFAFFLRFNLTRRMIICLVAIPIAYILLRIAAISFAGNSLFAGLMNRVPDIPPKMSASGMYDRLKHGLEFYSVPSMVVNFALFTAVILILMGFRDRTFRSVLETKLGQVRKN